MGNDRDLDEILDYRAMLSDAHNLLSIANKIICRYKEKNQQRVISDNDINGIQSKLAEIIWIISEKNNIAQNILFELSKAKLSKNEKNNR